MDIIALGLAKKGQGGGSITLDTAMSDVSKNGVQNKVIKGYVDTEIDNVKLAKFPNVTIIGEPTINNGQMRGFSANDYARFPFVVDLTNKAFEINFDILTGSNVATQQNIFDSDFGFAFAIRNSRFIFAISSNGQGWDIGESTGTNVVFPNTQYKIKLSWDRTNYKLQLSTNGGTSYVTDITKASILSPYPTQIYIGVGEDHAQVLNSFSGMIDFTNANLIIDNIIRWVGLDVVGIETRLAKDVSNIDEAGKEKIKEIAGTSIVELTEEHLTGETYNGKPVYRKMVTVNLTTATDWKSINHGIENIDFVLDTQGKLQSGFPINMYFTSSYYNVIYATQTTINYVAKGWIGDAILNITYTKTTD